VSNVCDKALNMRESCCEAKSDVRRGGRHRSEEVVHSRTEAVVVQKEPLLEEARGLDGVDGLAQLEGIGVG
jgi:hypothetical protein